jgi:hypothetical protein
MRMLSLRKRLAKEESNGKSLPTIDMLDMCDSYRARPNKEMRHSRVLLYGRTDTNSSKYQECMHCNLA